MTFQGGTGWAIKGDTWFRLTAGARAGEAASEDSKPSTRGKVRTAQRSTQKGKDGRMNMEQVTSGQITRAYYLSI